MNNFEKRFYGSVNANSSIRQDYVVPNNSILNIHSVGGDSIFSPEGHIEIIINPNGVNEILFLTYGSIIQTNLNKKIIGDGVKILRIKLINDSTSTHVLGGFFQGDLFRKG